MEMIRPTAVPVVITAAELAGRLRDGTAPRMIDVREPGEYAEEHIPRAENLPLTHFQSLSRTLSRDDEIALICRSGNRSGIAQRFLMQNGFTRTRNLVGGMVDWLGPTE